MQQDFFAMVQDINWFWVVLGSVGLLGLVVSFIFGFMNKDTTRNHKFRSFSLVLFLGYVLVLSSFLLNGGALSGLFQLGALGYASVVLFGCFYMLFNPTLLYGAAFSVNMVLDPIKDIQPAFQQELQVKELVQEKEEVKETSEVKEKMPSPAPRVNLTIEQSIKFRKLIKGHFADSLAFRKPGYAIRDLSNETGIPGYLVSLFINQEYGMNFNELINVCRVEYLAGLVKTSFDCEAYTLEAIGKMAGFNSRTAFIAAIKKYTGMTPSAFFGRKDGGAVECPIFNFPDRMLDVA